MSGYCTRSMGPVENPVILTIATTDSGGGAGIQADLKTITSLGGFGVSVAVALTAQNGVEVLGIEPLSPQFVRLQYEALQKGFPVLAAKTGMLYSSELIATVADMLSGKKFPLVVDPVCVSQSGYKLMQDDAVETMKQALFPVTDLLTPNRPETEMLVGASINTESDVRKAIEKILSMGVKAVLVKGGHFTSFGNTMTDWLGGQDGKIIPLTHEKIETGNNHGTGCTLSAAIATALGSGLPMQEAVEKAQNFLTEALRCSYCAGVGAGSPNFLGGALRTLYNK